MISHDRSLSRTLLKEWENTHDRGHIGEHMNQHMNRGLEVHEVQSKNMGCEEKKNEKNEITRKKEPRVEHTMWDLNVYVPFAILVKDTNHTHPHRPRFVFWKSP